MDSSPSRITPRFVRTHDAAAFLGLSGRTLEKHRCTGTGPVFRKLGGRVVYAIDDLEAWAAERARNSTSDPGRATAIDRHGAAAFGAAATSLNRADQMRRPLDDQQLELFRARPGDMASRDAQDLMS